MKQDITFNTMHEAYMYLATDNILNIDTMGGCKENPLKNYTQNPPSIFNWNQPTLLRWQESLGKMSLLNSATKLNQLLNNNARMQLR